MRIAAAQDHPAQGKRPAPGHGLPRIDYRRPAGAPALYTPDSVAWSIFKNPVALFVGGITAVLLELGEPRVRSGVWDHSIFPAQPLRRLQRTGYVTHASVYAPAATAERVIRAVNRMHDKVEGVTPDGQTYRANDPVLLDWVQCTVGFGFMEAYSADCRPLSVEEKDRSYREAEPVATLFEAHGAPRSVADQQSQFAIMAPMLEPHPIIGNFLDIMMKTPGVPTPLRPFQAMMIRAAIALLPDWAQVRLELDQPQWRLRRWDGALVRRLGSLFERLPIPKTPPVEASLRLGLPATYLYRGRKG